jgi:DNA adenine methylase
MNGPLKTHGGKHYLAHRIVDLMPPHLHYVEPFAGGLAVLLAKSCEGVSEVVNDLDGRITNFWRVLQIEELFAQFQRQVQAIPFSEPAWREAKLTLERNPTARDRTEYVDRAVQFFVLCRQSMAGRCKDFTPLTRNRTRGGMNEQVSSWLGAVEGLCEVHARLRRVVIVNQPAVEVIQSQDGRDTLFYLDPPYLPETRSSKDVFGAFEMTVEQHEELLEVVNQAHGMVMISGYSSALYDSHLAGWARHEFDVPNNASNGKRKRRMNEVVWCNFRTSVRQVA